MKDIIRSWVGHILRTINKGDAYAEDGLPVRGFRTDDQIYLGREPVDGHEALRKMDLAPEQYRTIFLPVADIMNPVEMQDVTGALAGMVWAYQRVSGADTVDRWTLYVWDANTAFTHYAPYRIKPDAERNEAWIALAGWAKLGQINMEGNLFPSNDDAYYLGHSGKRWRGSFASATVDKVPTENNDAANKAYVDGAIGGIDIEVEGTVLVQQVATLATPTELAAVGGTTGQLLVAWASGEPNGVTVYQFDTTGGSANAPYVVAGTGGMWVACGGRYSQGALNVSGALAAASLAVSGAVTAASVTASGTVQGGTVTATGALSGATATIAGAATVGSLSASGLIQGASVAATGGLSGASATISGTAAVGSLASSGAVSGTAGTFSGLMRFSGQPFVAAYKNAVQTIAHNTETTITNWTEVVDITGHFNAATGVFTAPQAGVYACSGKVTFTPNAVGLRALVFVVNGAFLFQYGTGGYDATAAASHVNVTTFILLAQGDTVAMSVFQNSGGALDIPISPDGARPWINIVKVA